MGSAWRAHAARTKRTDGIVDRRDDEVKRATSYRCHISRSPRSQESERQPVAEVMTRSATGGRRLPSYEARTYGRRDAFSGRRCAAKAGWTGAAAPVQSAERAPRPPSPQINLRLRGGNVGSERSGAGPHVLFFKHLPGAKTDQVSRFTPPSLVRTQRVSLV